LPVNRRALLRVRHQDRAAKQLDSVSRKAFMWRRQSTAVLSD
jgi:hypothetical protein